MLRHAVACGQGDGPRHTDFQSQLPAGMDARASWRLRLCVCTPTVISYGRVRAQMLLVNGLASSVSRARRWGGHRPRPAAHAGMLRLSLALALALALSLSLARSSISKHTACAQVVSVLPPCTAAHRPEARPVAVRVRARSWPHAA